jgi:hypothetical protein
LEAAHRTATAATGARAAGRSGIVSRDADET